MKELIPGVGDSKASKRIRQLEKEAGTLPVIFALFFTEALKVYIKAIPVPFMGGLSPVLKSLVEATKFILTAGIVAMLYIYEDERREYTKKAKEKASETADKAKEKASETADKAKEKADDVKGDKDSS